MNQTRHHSLLIILVAYLFLGLMYSATTPIFEAPDERQHYGYIQELAAKRRLLNRGEDSLAEHEASQPPLYYAVAALSTAWRGHDSPLILERNRYYGNYQAPGTVNDNKNVLLHTDLEAFPWRGAVLTVHITRLVNLLFGALTVGATYLLAHEIFAKPHLALCAAATVAFTPQFLFISSVINNDVVSSALSTVTLWLLVGGVRRRFSTGRASLLGVAIGLAALSKVSALALLPLTLLVVALRIWWTVPDSGFYQRLSRVFFRWAIVLGLALVVAGWWYVRNSLLYDDPLGLQSHFDAGWAYEEPLSLSNLWSQLPGVALSLWAAFGMGNVHLPKMTYVLVAFVVALAVAGLAAWVVRARQSKKRLGTRAWSLFVLGVWSLIVFAALFRWMQLVKAALGRLLFPAIGALAVLMVWGEIQFISNFQRLASGVPSDRSGIASSVLTGRVTAFFCIALAAPLMVIRPAYARPDLLSQEVIAARTHAADIQFGDSLRLAGYQLGRQEAHPGEEIPVTLCWECLARMEEEYAYFVHFLGSKDVIVGARDTYPGLGRFPTSQWTVGDAFCDVVRVPVDEQAPSQTVYDVEIGWYEPETGKRLSASTSGGDAMDLVVVEQIKITPEVPPAVTIPYRVDANLQDRITLLGYRLSQPEIRRSESLTVTLYWEAQTPLEDDYTVFVHLAAADGPPYAQDDSHPRGGSYPTSFWDAGEVVTDQHVLQIPENLPPGDHQLVVGMYLLETGDRLIWLAEDGTPRSDYVPLKSLAVRPSRP